MIKPIEEGYLTFTFEENTWMFAKKYDELTEYENMNKALDLGLTDKEEKVKNSGIDILALDKNKKLYLIEIKDPRLDESENADRKWDVEVAKKIKDTVSGIVGFSNTSDKLKKEFRNSLSCFLSNNFAVIFWLESSRISEKEKSYAIGRDRNFVGFSSWQKNLQKRLKWLTTNISLANAETYHNDFIGLKVEDKWRKGVNKHEVHKPRPKKRDKNN